MAAERVVTLAGEADFDGFRQAARGLLAAGVAPEAVRWTVAGEATPELMPAPVDDAVGAPAPEGAAPTPAPAQPGDAPTAVLHVPSQFIDLCRQVVLHRDRCRFALLYRLLWRLQRETALRHDALDADMALARLMAQAVRRDLHKMHAFVRFRQVGREALGLPPLHVAWFEPDHHIVDAAATFFVRRFTAMPWAILTPERSLRWDGRALTSGPGAARQDAPPADAGEALWLTYYESIFNPARLKLRAMEKEMPRRYWPNLPEARLISALSAQAHERSAGMVAREAIAVARRVPIPVMANDDSVAVHPASTPAPEPVGGGGGDRAQALLAQRDAALVCRECPLGALATQTVWGEGPVSATLMFVGEQPGDQEDLQGRPFVGPSGQLLDRAFKALDWDRSIAYVTNAVKHFKYEPRGKRRIHKTPAQREADACEHWLDSEIAIVQPKAIIALGATAARQLMGRPVAVMRERGQWLQRSIDGLPVLVTLHPSALLRLDAEQRDVAFTAWLADLRLADRFAHAGGADAGAAVPAGDGG